MTRSRRPPPPPPGMLAGWTVQRATVTGVATGLSALLLSAIIGSLPEGTLYLYGGLLALTILCGVSILWITANDIRTRGRGGRMRPIRAFDAAAGLLLILPAAYALNAVWSELGF
ncbi:MAG TPA: hypothetical protein VLK25_08800 [Allosphingosinicella sp.]|nr:hypothetical protein [Allosphingosinicella sp.]